MNVSIRSLTAGLATVVLAVAAQAQTTRGTDTPKIDRRDARQEQRVEQGQASGSLTQREASRLERRDATQDKAAEKAAADGTVTAQERKVLRKAERRTSRATYRQKHDAQTAPSK
jgi:hypothetical protein